MDLHTCDNIEICIQALCWTPIDLIVIFTVWTSQMLMVIDKFKQLKRSETPKRLRQIRGSIQQIINKQKRCVRGIFVSFFSVIERSFKSISLSYDYGTSLARIFAIWKCWLESWSLSQRHIHFIGERKIGEWRSK